MNEKTFHVIAQDHLKKEVEVVTVQGTYTGRLLFIGKDFIVLESRGRMREVEIAIRIEFIVAIFKVESFPRGAFGFGPFGGGHEEEHESSSEHHEHRESHDRR